MTILAKVQGDTLERKSKPGDPGKKKKYARPPGIPPICTDHGVLSKAEANVTILDRGAERR